MEKRYRPNVAAILQRPDGLVLIGQRSDHPDSWQFPQGGVDHGETPEDAVRREILEEIAVPPEAYRIVARSGPYRYDFPDGPDRRGFCGQEQHYFLCAIHDTGEPSIDLGAACGEFIAVRWVPVENFPVDLAPPMKRAVYRKVLQTHFAGKDWH